jgi:hypothetical protein
VDARGEQVRDAEQQHAQRAATAKAGGQTRTSQSDRMPCRALVLLRAAIRRPDEELRPECRYVGLTRAILMFVPTADTREAWKVSTDQAY